MTCDDCGTRLRVRNMRTPDTGRRHWVGRMSEQADSVVSWWASNFIARDRECPKCGRRVITVEVTTDDLRGMLQSAEQWPR
jgi:ssDNA-binding Zn-finger/Zn-ribbon topoisomerase 1